MSEGARESIGVVIPTYDRADRIVHAVESVLDQTRPPDELLVIDDGSRDDTATRLAPFGSRLRYLRQDNAGPAAARNRGLRETAATIVGFLDSDDRWQPETLAEIEREFRRHPDAGLVSIMAREVDAAGRLSRRRFGKRSPGTTYTTLSLLGPDSGGCSWFFARSEILRRVGGYDESLRSAEECDLVLRLSFETTLRALPRPLLLKGMQADNLSLDQRLNARCWIALLRKLGREQPAFVRSQPRAYRRALGREWLKLGRELLVHEADRADGRAEARRALRTSLRRWPFFVRAWQYLLWSVIAPGAYAGWRRRELDLRARRKSGGGS